MDIRQAPIYVTGHYAPERYHTFEGVALLRNLLLAKYVLKRLA
jgi:hypothetical protein